MKTYCQLKINIFLPLFFSNQVKISIMFYLLYEISDF